MVMAWSQRRLRQVHRWLGLCFSLSILGSAGSGVLHNVMTRTQPPPPAARPAELVDVSRVAVSVTDAATRCPSGHGGIQAVSLRAIADEPWYQFLLEEIPMPCYVSAETGVLSPHQDERYAAEIASRFLDGAPVRKTGYLTAFDTEYLNIFRILPVHRFDADDARKTRVYVSTMTGSVTRHTDRWRQVEADLFTNVHKLGFIPNKDWRDAILTTLTFGIVVVALLGVALFGAMTFSGRRQR